MLNHGCSLCQAGYQEEQGNLGLDQELSRSPIPDGSEQNGSKHRFLLWGYFVKAHLTESQDGLGCKGR